METQLIRHASHAVLSAILALSVAGSPLIEPRKPRVPDHQTTWSQPVEPFRIAGNLYYVGAAEVTSYLLTTPAGHILIDAGLPETAWVIAGNIERLGFELEDVRILLNSHAHTDHAGGLAWLKERTGARLFAMTGDAEVLERGHLFPAVDVDRVLHDLDEVELGGTSLTAHHTPGHTAGCTTWTTRIRSGDEELDVVIVGGAESLPHQDLGSESNVHDDFIETFTRLRALPVDIFLAAHGSAFDLSGKRARLAGEDAVRVFTDPEGYHEYLEREEVDFLMKVDAQLDSDDEVRV